MATVGIAINPDRIKTFFDELETRKSLLTTITHLHQTLTHHFSVLDQSLSQKTLTLESQIQALDSHTKETLDSLQIRENAIPDRLSAASARIKKQEQAAISAAGDHVGERRLLEKYCRNMDWKGLLGFVLAKKGEAVGDREEGSALREKIAAAVAEESVDGMRLVLEAVEEFVDSRVKGEMMAVADRRWACGVLIQAVVETGRGDGDGGVGRGMKEKAVGVLEKWKEVMAREKNGGFGAGEARMFLQIVIGFGLKEMVGEEYLRKLLLQFTTKRHIGQFAKLAVTLGLGDQVKGKEKETEILAAGNSGDRSLLRDYCRTMDAKRLLRFVLAKREEASADRDEGLVLREEIAAAVAEESVDGIRMVLEVVEEFVDLRVEGKVAVADRRWACGVLIQAVVEPGRGEGGVERSMKEKAFRVLEKWKRVIGRGKNGGFADGEARMFLQIVVGLGLKEVVGEEYLKNLLVKFATRRHMAKLAVALGLGDHMKGIVEGLAISRKTAHIISKTGKYITAAVEEANDLELNATMAMIKSAEDKLESKSTIDSLWKRVQQLEKAKEENKKSATTSTSKPPNKQGRRGSGGPPSYRSKSGRFSNASPSFRSPQAAPATFRIQYNYASRNIYEGPGPALYAPGYGAAAGARAVGSYGGQGSYAGPRNYGPHDPSAAAGPAYPPYQGYHH